MVLLARLKKLMRGDHEYSRDDLELAALGSVTVDDLGLSRALVSPAVGARCDAKGTRTFIHFRESLFGTVIRVNGAGNPIRDDDFSSELSRSGRSDSGEE